MLRTFTRVSLSFPVSFGYPRPGNEKNPIRMRITLDFTAGIGDPTGVGTYTRELARALRRLDDNFDLRIAVHAFRHSGWRARIRDALPAATRDEIVVNRLLPHGLLLEAERRFAGPPLESYFGPCDVFHGTNFLAPPSLRARTVISIHDLAFLRLGASLPVPHRYERYLAGSVRRAHRLIAVSEATARDVREWFPDAADRVRVVHEGAPRDFRRLADDEFRRWRRAAGVPERYFLFVGTIEPRKNLPLLARALADPRVAVPRDVGLVVAGRRGWHVAESLRELARVRLHRPVLLPGFVPEPVRNSLLAGALALVLPSRWEGFGLPVLEAFRAGAPVIASTAGALPEVAADAALLFPPGDESALADALVRMSREDDLRRDLAARGARRAEAFSWDRAARETLEVYRGA